MVCYEKCILTTLCNKKNMVQIYVVKQITQTYVGKLLYMLCVFASRKIFNNKIKPCFWLNEKPEEKCSMN